MGGSSHFPLLKEPLSIQKGEPLEPPLAMPLHVQVARNFAWCSSNLIYS